MAGLIIAILSIAVAWFALFRPLQQRNREHRAMLDSLVAGDRIITAGGLYGTLVEVGEETMRIEVAPGLVLTMARAAVRRRQDDAAAVDGAAGPGRATDRRNDEVEERVEGTQDRCGGRDEGRTGPGVVGGAA